ncbi:hypothetical protein BCR41DRAFT_412878 [Lobosporangium transversale]|uniref:Uncharacterized protein n=1 Tax=Lobosporangium transversale TaxID=64571 RepID=A0A1Y2GFT7_9FUNG|nr:hypothetical protein BCR41DRAFT_412878 [Lobosporangium transversale]ORZ06378.1 hypothetical protein BCR41DRAFT_412878 [Lobosporangium transversale]|eukprot:XP_021877541.1 hypothetical protein BCR41DRAFT_412878 [Lobosporangium transversale]
MNECLPPLSYINHKHTSCLLCVSSPLLHAVLCDNLLLLYLTSRALSSPPLFLSIIEEQLGYLPSSAFCKEDYLSNRNALNGGKVTHEIVSKICNLASYYIGNPNLDRNRQPRYQQLHNYRPGYGHDMELEYSRSYEELLLLLLQQQESESVAKIAIDYPKDFRNFLLPRSPKKREKALLASNMYQKKLMTLLLPQTHTDFNHTVSFLGKEGVYTLGHGGVPYHDQNGKFVTKGCLYEVLAYCRRKSPKEDVMKHLQRLGINGKPAFDMKVGICFNVVLLLFNSTIPQNDHFSDQMRFSIMLLLMCSKATSSLIHYTSSRQDVGQRY